MEAGRRLAGLAFRGMLRAGKELALLPGDNGPFPTAWSTLRERRSCCLSCTSETRLFVSVPPQDRNRLRRSVGCFPNNRTTSCVGLVALAALFGIFDVLGHSARRDPSVRDFVTIWPQTLAQPSRRGR